MNKERRQRLEEVLSLLEDAKVKLEDIQNEEQECLDNLPENLQGSERYETMEEIVSNLENAVSSLDDAIDNVNESLV